MNIAPVNQLHSIWSRNNSPTVTNSKSILLGYTLKSIIEAEPEPLFEIFQTYIVYWDLNLIPICRKSGLYWRSGQINNETHVISQQLIRLIMSCTNEEQLSALGWGEDFHHFEAITQEHKLEAAIWMYDNYPELGDYLREFGFVPEATQNKVESQEKVGVELSLTSNKDKSKSKDKSNVKNKNKGS